MTSRPAPSVPAARSDSFSALGYGAVRVGMNYSELAPFMVNPSDTSSIRDGCDFVRFRGAPSDIEFMVEQRHLVRIQTQSASYASPEGIRVGDPQPRIVSVYPGARKQPHKYNDGYYYFIVLPLAPADTLHRYVFETDGKNVTTWRAGVYPPVEYVEGCS